MTRFGVAANAAWESEDRTTFTLKLTGFKFRFRCFRSFVHPRQSCLDLFSD